MKVSLNEIKQVFDSLIQEKKTREEISNWAIELQFTHDDRNLIFDPPDEKDKIWDAISYLTGVDLLDIDGTYLHSIDNFIDFRKENDF